MYKYSGLSEPFDTRPPHGGFNWFEIPSTDPDATRNFYQAIFPSWKFENPPHYPSEFIQLFKVEQPSYMEGAIIMANPQSKSSTNAFKADAVGFVPFFLTDSIDKLEEKVVSLGGKPCGPKTDGRGDGWFAKFFDQDGNVFGAWEVRVKS
ncbi:hypothetical protein CkaCkLH20_07242 [Colletotrichum karsti]|uniref:VOC domain-containing protein n=1 Tax=Colletotrichum karsti TaxID=1095194 RepID=A0A9P6I445_9PEZI|nr:uncharacterized protein CkaCkLH20_07242 [Colletotrichum karsti]KAF9875422.1 hypothetical protein CkaCkLH20_07242 [Colletotrichum karsti]